MGVGGPGSRFRALGPYLGKRPFKGVFERDGISITFEGWSYGLEQYFRALEGAGFLVERLREPVPVGLPESGKDLWRRSERIPMFLFARAVKTPTA